MPKPKYDTGRTVKAISRKTVTHVVVEESDPEDPPFDS